MGFSSDKAPRCDAPPLGRVQASAVLRPDLRSWCCRRCRLRLASHRAQLLASRLATMARDTQALAVRHVIPITALAHWHDVIGLGLAVAAAHSPARLALPAVTGKHGTTPRAVSLVAVAASGSRRPRAVVSASSTGQASRLVAGNLGWHDRDLGGLLRLGSLVGLGLALGVEGREPRVDGGGQPLQLLHVDAVLHERLADFSGQSHGDDPRC